MKIGNIQLENNIILAPMAGITDQSFRLLCRQEGCGLVFSEMISAQGLFHNNKRTEGLLFCTEAERPYGVQIFGSDPFVMGQAASLVTGFDFVDFIDINMGCPTSKIVKNGDGAALLTKPHLAGRIVNEVVKSSTKPVTVKIRKGWDENSINALEMAVIIAEAGASALTIHGRTRMEFYSGTADWEIIKKVKSIVNIPVIGNGDVFNPQDAERMMEQTRCDGVMIGRGALGNPWIFSRTKHFLETGEILHIPSMHDRVYKALEHLNLVVTHKGENLAVREMRKHISWYIKGLKNSTNIKNMINRLDKIKDIERLLLEYLDEIPED